MRGYREVFVRSGVWHGQVLPRHGRFHIRLAPSEAPGALVAFATNDNSGNLYIPTDQVSDIRAISDGITFFGFGLSGMIAAGVASRLDRLLAPWDLLIAGPPGQIHLYATHGPPPLADEWALVQERIQLLQWAGSAEADLHEGSWEDLDDEDLDDEDLDDEDLDDEDPDDEDPDLAGAAKVTADIYRRRLGHYRMNMYEFQMMQQVLDAVIDDEDLVVKFEGRLEDLRRADAILGTASAGRWYAHDDQAQLLVDMLAEASGDAMTIMDG